MVFSCSLQSLPIRGAWIEISKILVFSCIYTVDGERGLKYKDIRISYIAIWSLPIRGAWIEILE